MLTSNTSIIYNSCYIEGMKFISTWERLGNCVWSYLHNEGVLYIPQISKTGASPLDAVWCHSQDTLFRVVRRFYSTAGDIVSIFYKNSVLRRPVFWNLAFKPFLSSCIPRNMVAKQKKPEISLHCLGWFFFSGIISRNLKKF